jgi:hypothetical protein
MAAALHREEALASLAEGGADAALLDDLLLGDDAPAAHDVDGDVVLGVRRLLSLVRMIDDSAPLRALFDDSDDPAAILAALDGAGDGAPSAFCDLRRALAAHVESALPEGALRLEEPRLAERPERLVGQLLRMFRSPRPTPAQAADVLARRRRAEQTWEQILERQGGLKAATARKRLATGLGGLRRHAGDVAALWVPTERVIAGLRRVALALGERLFEHGLVDQPRDVFLLQDAEIAGVIRGTAPDVDVRPLVTVRRRAAASRPASLARRVQTHGVVATSLLVDDEDDAGGLTGPGSVAVAGGAQGPVCLLDRAPPGPVRGVVITAAVDLGDLPLLALADAVVAERGAPLAPASHALRRLGVPTIVGLAGALDAFGDGELVTVEDGVVRPSSSSSSPAGPARAVVNGVEAASTTPDAAVSRRPERPGDISGELAAPPPAGLHDAVGRPLPPTVPSADGEPVGDDDVVESKPLP